MKEQIQILIDGKEIEYYELDSHLNNLEYITKEDGKWVIYHKKPIEYNKIDKLDLHIPVDNSNATYNGIFMNKINEIIDYINKEK